MLFCFPGLPHAAAGSRFAVHVHVRDIHRRHIVDHDYFVSSSWDARRSELLLVSPEHYEDSVQFSAITGDGLVACPSVPTKSSHPGSQSPG
jgi:hypothetical protein